MELDKWLKLTVNYQHIAVIKAQLSAVLNCYPHLSVSASVYHHENNRQSKLLTLNGDLSINNTVVPIIVWISELYPFHAPYVYVGMSSVANNVDPNGRLHLKYTTGWSAQHDLVTLMKHVEKSLNTQISAAHPPVYPPLSQGSPVQHVLLPQQDLFVKVLYEIEVAEKGLIKGERAMMLKSDCNGKQLIAKFTLPSSSLYDLTHFALFNSANFEYDPDSPLSALFPSKGLAQNDPIVLHLKRAW